MHQGYFIIAKSSKLAQKQRRLLCKYCCWLCCRWRGGELLSVVDLFKICVVIANDNLYIPGEILPFSGGGGLVIKSLVFIQARGDLFEIYVFVSINLYIPGKILPLGLVVGRGGDWQNSIIHLYFSLVFWVVRGVVGWVGFALDLWIICSVEETIVYKRVYK